MADISILKSLAQMDGVFGCKVVCQTDTSGKTSNSFQRKNFFEWVCDVLFDLHFKSATNPRVLAALDEIAVKVKDAETGEFKKLVDSYKSSGAKIDFREIRKTLEASLSWEFPPRVFSRDGVGSCDLTLVSAYKDVHRKNMNKGLCLGRKSMPLILNAENDKVTDANIRGYCELAHEMYLKKTVPLLPEMDEQNEIRIKLMAATIDEENRVPRSEDRDAEIQKLERDLAELQKATPGVAMRNFKDDYLQEINKIVSGKSRVIELFVASNGSISKENIAGFVEAIIHLEISEKKKGIDDHEMTKKLAWLKKIVCTVSVPVGAIEESTDVKGRVMDAYMERRKQWLTNL